MSILNLPILTALIFFTLSVFIPENVFAKSIKLSKTSYSIAIYGDSMVDTMGEQLEYLQASLKKRYPKITFYYYNYGIGSQNVSDGLVRFHQPLNYKTRNYPAISSLKPDIIIFGSFGYNPYHPYNRDQHWTTLTKLVIEAKNIGSDVYMLSEIAPLKFGFGKGKNGVNWQDRETSIHVQHIIEQLENAIYLSLDHLKVPLINAYFLSLVDGKYGSKRYVDPSDGIHPSVAGHQFMAELIASKIRLR